MAQQVQLILIDDLDGESEAQQTVAFAIDGIAYELDLTEGHAAEVREVFAPYIEAGRRAGRARPGGRGSRSRGRSRAADEPSAEEVRSWARSKKLKVSSRGRVARSVIDAYRAAH